MSVGKFYLWCPFFLHLVHHSSSWNSFPLLMFWSYTPRFSNCDWICIIPEIVFPIGEDFNFISISRAYVCDIILCYIKKVQICGIKEAINHSLCCTFEIWKLTLAINVLNLWAKSQKDSIGSFLISFISVIHCDSSFILLNSSIRPS